MCFNPFGVKGEYGKIIPVGCGKCMACKNRLIGEWAFRLNAETKSHDSVIWATLTYDTSSVPITPKGYMTLDKTDMQKFFKRLRRYTGKHIKYFYVGEYGEKNWRPHYHVFVFGATADDITNAWRLDGREIGFVHFGKMEGASIRYTLKYMMKEPRIPRHKNDDRLKEFRLMSKNLGMSFLTPEMVKFLQADPVTTSCIAVDGKRYPLPRYYRDKVYSEAQKELIALHYDLTAAERSEAAQMELIELHGDIWEEVRREWILKQQQKMYSEAQKGRHL